MRVRFGNYVIDVDRRELRAEGELVGLQRQVFDVLAHLVRNRDRVVPKTELLDEVWGDRFVSDSAMSTRIKEVRRAVGDSGSEQAVVRTVHGVGYRFVADATEVAERGHTDGAPRPGTAPSPAPPPRVDTFRVPRTRYAERAGSSIAYQTFGEGPDLVIVSGFTTNVELLWEHPAIADILQRLGSFARVTLFDKRGVGCSERSLSEAGLGLEARADDLLAVLAAAEVDRATLLGTSEGGALSALFAATHPERVERLVLHGTWAKSVADSEEYKRLIDEWWGTGAIYGALGPSLASTKDGTRWLARYERQSATPKVTKAIIDVLDGLDVSDVLDAIRVPTLVLHATDDEYVPLQQAQLLHAGIEGSTLVPLNEPDHYLFACDPVELMKPIREFVIGRSDHPIDLGERQLATILFCDIVGSTGRAAALGDAAWSDLLDRFYQRGSAAIGFSRGELINTTGDGLLAVFDGPGRAISAAVALNRAVEPLGLQLRSGVHCAEIQRRGSDVTGIGVNIASRIADLAEPDEIWVSRTITDLVAGNDLRFSERGEHELRGVEQSWPLFALEPA